MNTLGEKIAELRKERSMTQEELAGIIGVSAQSISKWENNVSMPDIMLLPLLAEIFGTTIDELFSIEHKLPKLTFPYEETPAAVYDGILNTMWQNENPDYASAARKRFADCPNLSSGFVSSAAGGVYADRDLALAFLPDYKKAAALLDSEGAAELLSILADPAVRKVLKYQAEDPGRSFTSASAAVKTGIPEGNVTEALEKLVRYNFTIAHNVDIGSGETLRIYQMYGAHKMILLVYPLLSLAERLSDFRESWFGFKG